MKARLVLANAIGAIQGSWEGHKASFYAYVSANEKRRMMVRALCIGFAIFSGVTIYRWTDHLKPLSVVAWDRPDLVMATLLIDAVPWLFWGSASLVAISAGWMAFDAFVDDKERQRFNLFLVRVAVGTCAVATAMLWLAGFFNNRFDRIEFQSEQHRARLTVSAEKLTLHDKALLNAALAGDEYAKLQLRGSVATIFGEASTLERPDYHALQEIVRASLIGGTLTQPIAGGTLARTQPHNRKLDQPRPQLASR